MSMGMSMSDDHTPFMRLEPAASLPWPWHGRRGSITVVGRPAATAATATIGACGPRSRLEMAEASNNDGHDADPRWAYQQCAIEEARHHNLLVVLPTNAGKTIIAAETIRHVLDAEAQRKIIFLAPSVPLVEQQCNVLLNHVGGLDLVDGSRTGGCRRKIAMAIGRGRNNDFDAPSLNVALTDAQIITMTPELFYIGLSSGRVRMADVALIVIDEAHNVRKTTESEDVQHAIMKYFYWPSERKPRVLALTASPVESKRAANATTTAEAAEGSTDAERLAEAELRKLEDATDTVAWAARVELPTAAVSRREVPEPPAALLDDVKLILGAVDSARPQRPPSAESDGAVPAAAGGGGVGVRPPPTPMEKYTLARLQADWANCVDVLTSVGRDLGVHACIHGAKLLLEHLAPERSSEREYYWHADAAPEAAPDHPNAPDAQSTRDAAAILASPAHQHLERARGTRLKEELLAQAHIALRDALSHPQLAPLAAHTLEDAAANAPKLEALLGCLREGRARPRTLVFTNRRVMCRLLAELLGAQMPALGFLWTTGTSAARGRDASAPADVSLKAQRATLDAFRAPSERPLVLCATAVLAEGIDVPTCEAVIRFDPPSSQTQYLQSRGRARADGSHYVELVRPRALLTPKEAAQRQQRAQWEALLTPEWIMARRARRLQEVPERAATRRAEARLAVKSDAVHVPETGATLPLSKCKAFLHTFVYGEELSLGGGGGGGLTEVDYGRHHFTDGTKRSGGVAKYPFKHYSVRPAPPVHAGGATLFECDLLLEPVGLCTRPRGHPQADGEEPLLPHVIQARACESQKRAMQLASLMGVRYLHAIGVLDAHLAVVGRHELKSRLFERLLTPSTRRYNSYLRHTREGFVRRLPRALTPAPAPTPAAASGAAAWAGATLHRLFLDGEACSLGLLLPARIERISFLAQHGGSYHEWLVEPAEGGEHDASQAALSAQLTEEMLSELSTWLVGSFDLVQAGNAGEPLHPTLRPPRRMLGFDSVRGEFPAAPLPFEPVATDATASCSGSSAVSRWLDVSPSLPAHAARVTELARLISALGTKPLVVLDLDSTLWHGACDGFVEGARGGDDLTSQTVDGTAQLYNKAADGARGRSLALFDEVELVLDALHRARIGSERIAVAVATLASRDAAMTVLHKFGFFERGWLTPDLIECGDAAAASPDAEAPAATDVDELETFGGGARLDSKYGQLQRLASTYGSPLASLLLFDDTAAHVTQAEELGGHGVQVSAAKGLTAEALLGGLERFAHRATVAAAPAPPDAASAPKDAPNADEQSIVSKEARRKALQSRQSREEQRRAEAHAGPEQARLDATHVEPAAWLLVPLEPSSGAIDFDFVRLANACLRDGAWPTLGTDGHPLLAAAMRVHDAAAATSPVGGTDVAAASYALSVCCLALQRPARAHAIMLSDVHCDGGLVSGRYTPRAIRPSNKTRLQTAGGHWTNRDTDLVSDYAPADVRALPLRCVDVYPLKAVRRALWRLEHLLLVREESSGTAPPMSPPPGAPPHGAAPRVSCLAPPPAPARPLPLPLLCASLSHKDAAAEALSVDAAFVPGSDVVPRIHYEVLEWVGDAVLHLLATAAVMLEQPGSDEGELTRAREGIEQNLVLCRKAVRMGLPTMLLGGKFLEARTLPECRKQLVSRKEQADAVEALLGAVFEAQLTVDTTAAGLEATGGDAGGDAGSGDADAASWSLLPALEAAKSVYDAHLHAPPEAAAAQTLRSQPLRQQICDALHGFRSSEERFGGFEADVEGRVDEIVRALRLPAARAALRRPALLTQVLRWSKAPPFQRLEFLGDAVLELMVTVELTRRHGALHEGELSTVRDRLVSNLTLGACLVRRFGADGTLRFFEGHARDADLLHRHVHALAESDDGRRGGAPPALPALVLRESSPLEPGDVRKRLGDVYEALLGLAVLEHGGDLETAWRSFRGDFFEEPPAALATEPAAALADQSALRKALAELKLREAQRRVRAALPPVSEADDAAAAVVNPPVATTQPPAPAGDSAVLMDVTDAPTTTVVHAPPPDSARPAKPEAFVSAVNEILQRCGFNPPDAHLTIDPRGGPPWGVRVRVLPDGPEGNSDDGHQSKKHAKNQAFERLYDALQANPLTRLSSLSVTPAKRGRTEEG